MANLTQSQWQRVFELLTKISALSEPDQEAALDAASEDPAIVEQVRAALHAECESETVSSQAGRVLGHYTVGAELGRGAMGQVYQARDQELDRHVAIKFLPPEVLGKDAVVNRFVHEAKASSLLNHPNIVTIHQFIREADTLAIVMERIDGQTLRSLIQSQTISCAQALGYAQQIAEGLGAAHAHGIIHRDIKPENIMIRSDGYVKILDFGLAGLTLEADSPRTYTPSGLTSLGGTPRYMSPEQERRESLTPASDIYSFGLVLKEMAPPFGPLKTLVNLMLDPNAARRPSASAVAGRLQLLRKSRRPWLRFVVAAILICSVTAWYFWNRRTAATNSIGLRQLTMQITENRVTASAISPDGKQLAYATVDGIFLQAVATGESRLLQAPKDFWVDRIRWFAGGDRLLAGGFSRSSQHAAIWTVSASGQVPVLFREDSRDPQPSHDGTQVAFTDGGRTALWSAGPAGENPRRILSIESDHLAILYWSADASHVAFNRISTPIQMDPTAVLSRFGNVSGMMGVYESVDLRTGQIDVRYQGEVPLSAAVLRPGSVIFLSPEPTNRQAGNCLWQMQIDPRTAGPLGKPVRLPMKAEWVHDLSAAADGHTVSLIRVTSLPTIHVGDFSPEVPAIRNVRRLTLDASHSFPHSWTADSRAVIFESDRRGNNDLFRQDIDSRVAESIVGTAGEDFHASLTPEGNRVLFMQGSIGSLLPAAIMRAPLAGGGAEEVIKRGVVDEFRCAFPGGSGCIARTNHEGQTYNFYQLDATRGLGREVARTKWLPNIYGDWALSPHGTEVAIPNHDRKSAVIRLISLDQGTERELVLPGIVSLSGLNWTADGKGWFVCITTSVGGQIVYADRRGRIKSLLDVGSYVVPSPDGRHVAIMIPSVTTNVWTVEGL